MNRATTLRLAQIGLLWVGFALMLRLLDRFALREDEAIYSYWALHFWQVDPYFLTVWPDKPPLFLWLLAGVLQFWGATQASGRLLNIMVTLLTALVVGATARRLWGQTSGLVATAFYLLNPFALSFAPTVYTDPLLVLTGQLAFFCAITGRSLGAGLWLAAAIMTKQQGIFYLPLVMMALWLRPCVPATTATALPIQRWLPFVGGLLLVIAPIVYWDSSRWAVAPSPWDLSVRTYGGVEVAALDQWLPRAYEWAKLLWYLTASWLVWLIFGGVLVAVLWRQWGRERGATRAVEGASSSGKILMPSGAPQAMKATAKARRTQRASASSAFFAPLRLFSGQSTADFLVDRRDLPGRFASGSPGDLLRWLVFWCGAFLVLHITTTIQLWDRYLLPLAPPFCLFAAWSFTQVRNSDWWRRQPQWRLGAGMVSLLCLLPPALTATNGALPIGGDHGAYNGLTATIARLQAEAPDDAILYHQRLGWHYQFYLFDEVTTGAYDLRWYPTATYLAANAAQSPHRPRFLVLPDWAQQPDLPLHLATRRLALQPITHVDHMTLYRIENQPQVGCVWCRCQGRSLWPIWPTLDRPGEFCLP